MIRILLLVWVILIPFLLNSCASHNTQSDEKLITALDSNVVLPPAWAFGVLYGGYTNQSETIDRVKDIVAHDYPIDAYWIDSWFWSYNDRGQGPARYIDFVADTIAFPDRREMWNFLQQNSIKGGFWVWDCIQRTGNESAYDEFNRLGFFSSTFLNTNPWHNKGTSTAMFQTIKNEGTWCGNIDFKNPAAVFHFKKRMRHFFEEGADFIKLDRTSSIETCKAMFEMTQEFGKETKGRGLIFSHSDGTDREEYKRYPVKWTDDTRADWSVTNPTKNFDSWVPRVAFKENIEMFIDSTKATSRIPFLANDAGGFDVGKDRMPNEELYIRWIQFSAFTPIMEVFSQPENVTSNLPYKYSPLADSVFHYYSHFRMRLFPYIYSHAHLARLQSKPLLRQVGDNLQFLFGDDLLVIPVHMSGERSVNVKLPVGDWVNYYDGSQVEGDKTLSVSAPLNRIPMFVRSGSIIPMREYASSIERGTNDLLTIHLFPNDSHGSSQFNLIEDDGTSNDYLSNGFSITQLGYKHNQSELAFSVFPSEGEYKGMRSQRQWKFIIHGLKITRAKVRFEGKTYQLALDKDGLISPVFTTDNVKLHEFVFDF